MSHFVAVYHLTSPRRLASLAAHASALLHTPTTTGVTVFNVAMLPREARVYVYAEAPSALLLAQELGGRRLDPLSIECGGNAEWGRLVNATARRDAREEQRDEIPYHGRPATTLV